MLEVGLRTIAHVDIAPLMGRKVQPMPGESEVLMVKVEGIRGLWQVYNVPWLTQSRLERSGQGIWSGA